MLFIPPKKHFNFLLMASVCACLPPFTFRTIAPSDGSSCVSCPSGRPWVRNRGTKSSFVTSGSEEVFCSRMKAAVCFCLRQLKVLHGRPSHWSWGEGLGGLSCEAVRMRSSFKNSHCRKKRWTVAGAWRFSTLLTWFRQQILLSLAGQCWGVVAVQCDDSRSLLYLISSLSSLLGLI